MKPKIGVPQLWYYPGQETGFDAVRIVYPDGSVEVSMEVDQSWELSFLSEVNQKRAVAQLIDYGHEFVCNLE